MSNVITEKMVNLAEAYEMAQKHIPRGSILPFYHRETDKPSACMVIGHIYTSTLSKTKKDKLRFFELCKPIVFQGKGKFICSVHHDFEENLVVFAAASDKFDPKEWPSEDYIVEI